MSHLHQLWHGPERPGTPLSSSIGGRILKSVRVHLVDGTYELFRYFLSPAAAFDRKGPEELRAVRGVVASLLGMLEGGATHLGVATDHVIESFRNPLWADYKTGEGIDPVLYAQFEPLEDALRALGVVVWAMVEFEADDALCAAAQMAAADARVEQVLVCTPTRIWRNACAAIGSSSSIAAPASVATRRAVRASSASIPGPFRTGSRSWATAPTAIRACRGGGRRPRRRCSRGTGTSSTIPERASDWAVPVRGAARLAATLSEQRERALLFRQLATLRADVPLGVDVDALRWTGPRPDPAAWSERLGAPQLRERAAALATARARG